MGLDGVELVMEFEDEFELVISNDDAERMRTVGDVIAFIAEDRELSFVRECPTAHVFYGLRRELKDLFNLDRKQIHPSTRISKLLSPLQHKRFINRLPEIGMSIPHIDRKLHWQDTLYMCAAAFPSIGISIYFGNPLWLFSFIPFLVILSPVSGLLPKLNLSPAQHFRTLGDLSRLLAKQYVIKSETDQEEISAISLKVRTLVANQMGYELDDVRESMRFIEDLLTG